MGRTIAVIGAGPGIGMGVARRFGAEDYSVALLARGADRLDAHVADLKEAGVDAAAFPADITDRGALVTALRAARDAFGSIDVVEFGPAPSPDTLVIPREITVDNVQFQFEYGPLAAIAAVREVLPEMLARGDGAILFTSAASAIHPVAFSSNFAVAQAALRSYAHSLHDDVRPDGVYVGMLLICGFVDTGAGDEAAAGMAEMARATGLSLIPMGDVVDLAWRMCSERDGVEEVAGDLDALHRLAAG
jgi:short-subunit dehydrogenase